MGTGLSQTDRGRKSSLVVCPRWAEERKEAMNNPKVRHGSTTVFINGRIINIRIMLVMYDGAIETYYQEEGYPYEFAYGVAEFEGFHDAMQMAIAHAEEWGLHYE